MSTIEIHELSKVSCPIKAAIFDFDGTISTLRCGWEQVMERIMLNRLSPSGMSEEELLKLIRAYIEESTGIQTIYQMEWLAGQVERLCGTTPLDPWEYKDEYNEALLHMVNERIERLEKGEADPDEFLVAGSRRFLQLLAEKGIDIYIASGTDDVDLQREAALLKIAPWLLRSRVHPTAKKTAPKKRSSRIWWKPAISPAKSSLSPETER